MVAGQFGKELQVKAIVIDAPGMKALLREIPSPVPGYGEVLVRTRGCGICGTDQHILHEGLSTATYPIIPGHEPWGEIAELGDGVLGIQVGDIVAVDPSLHCGRCDECRRARGNLCHNWGAIGGSNPGAWAEYFVAPAKNIYQLDANFPTNLASIIEPVACALRGLVRINPKQGQSVLIFGGGTMGILLAILLDINGCASITIIEKNAKRRQIASARTGLTFISPEEGQEIRADLVIDATGVAEVIEEGVTRTLPGGTFMIFGVAAENAEVKINPYLIYKDEITITSSMAILHTYGPAIETIQRYPEKFAKIITHNFSFEEFEDAFQVLASGEAIKVSLNP
jgi:2-desacetyl-2-hydroxyethyl bacteriochlorophyllide A dehydrogenase